MKKSIIIVALMAMFMGASAQSHWFNFANNKDRFGVGFNCGLVGWHTEFSDFGAGASINVMGVYLDYMQAGPKYKYDNHVIDALYEDSVAFVINAGYQIPVLPWLRVMPMVGYCQTNNGYTDATTVNVEVDDDHSARIYHDYYVAAGSRRHHFNFGAGLFVQPIRWLEIYAVGSMNALYGGISINLGAMKDFTE